MEGSEQFVKTYFGKLQAILSRSRPMASAASSVRIRLMNIWESADS